MWTWNPGFFSIFLKKVAPQTLFPPQAIEKKGFRSHQEMRRKEEKLDVATSIGISYWKKKSCVEKTQEKKSVFSGTPCRAST
jgi:hypothetical protein